MEGVLRKQLISRFITVGATAGAIILLLYIVINLWVLRPVGNLSTAAKARADRNFTARSDLTGPADFQLLAQEFNVMANALPNTTSNIKDDATIVAFEVQEQPSV